MSYIGNQVGNRFVASQAATRFSGNGSNKVFTLDHSVGSDEDILVSVDGVIQEPSISYVVSNGTTLTFQGTDAPSNGTNNIFVCYLFRTVATVGHPSTSALSATSGTFSGAITGGGTFTPGGNIVIPDAGNIGSASDTDAMAISSGGVVTFTQNTVGAGGMDLILSSTLTSSLGNIDISSTYINSTYDELTNDWYYMDERLNKKLTNPIKKIIDKAANVSLLYFPDYEFANEYANQVLQNHIEFTELGVDCTNYMCLSEQMLLKQWLVERNIPHETLSNYLWDCAKVKPNKNLINDRGIWNYKESSLYYKHYGMEKKQLKDFDYLIRCINSGGIKINKNDKWLSEFK